MKLTNGYPASGNVVRPVMAELGDNNAYYDHADAHDDGANEQHRFSADSVDN